MDASETTPPGVARNSVDRAVAGQLFGLVNGNLTDDEDDGAPCPSLAMAVLLSGGRPGDDQHTFLFD
ncbi:MAG: hypothetical protein F4123_12220 [Gemmatimonadetes bacterium]|nr:hypothetical protein [Gemmatimonadales bacterium]MYI47120.1 hypothetical protein [Gemmatimonadota bacterium]